MTDEEIREQLDYEMDQRIDELAARLEVLLDEKSDYRGPHPISELDDEIDRLADEVVWLERRRSRTFVVPEA